VPEGVRRAILNWFQANCDISPKVIGHWLLAEEGFGSWSDLAGALGDWFGASARNDLLAALRRLNERRWVADPPGVDPYAVQAICVLPTALFLTAVEGAVQMAQQNVLPFDHDLAFLGTDITPPAVAEVNRLFDKHGVTYRMTRDGQIVWHGDEGAYSVVVAPALVALRDARLVGARAEFEASLLHLREGTDKGREDAIEEAGKAVESSMKVVLDGRGIPRDPKLGAEQLWDLLKGNGLVGKYTKDAILAASRIRNELGGHGAGSAPREIAERDAELCVRAAATAIVFLASLLS
jgi:hypothetical protein